MCTIMHAPSQHPSLNSHTPQVHLSAEHMIEWSNLIAALSPVLIHSQTSQFYYDSDIRVAGHQDQYSGHLTKTVGT
jgi:hypothetical protein